MSPLTRQQKIDFDNATTCQNCKNLFRPNSNHKFRHHNHTTGCFLGAVCNNCNLQLKYGKRKLPDTEKDQEFFIPVIAHNMKGYDSHLILKGYEKRYSDSSFRVIPSNTEKFIAFVIGKLRFFDSLQFLMASLDKLVGTLSADAFKFTTKFYSALTETDITDDDYRRTQEAWTTFDCETMQDYHDVLLLVDVFENFREMCLKN